MSAASRHLTPIRVATDGTITPLTRLRLGDTDGDLGHREAFVQKLIFDHPDLIPMLDIEPAFTPLISVCMELETPAGPIDNLWVTPAGGLVLGECKLVRNPQARREVIAHPHRIAPRSPTVGTNAVPSGRFDLLTSFGSAR